MIEQEFYQVYIQRMTEYHAWTARRFWRRWLEHLRWIWWGEAFCPRCDKYTVWDCKEHKGFSTLKCSCGLVLVIRDGELYDISIGGF